MEMPVVVKKRLLDLLHDDHKNYYELVSFFFDGDISNFEKEKKAVNFLAQEFDTMKSNKISLPNEIEEIRNWYNNENRKVCLSYQDYL